MGGPLRSNSVRMFPFRMVYMQGRSGSNCLFEPKGSVGVCISSGSTTIVGYEVVLLMWLDCWTKGFSLTLSPGSP